MPRRIELLVLAAGVAFVPFYAQRHVGPAAAEYVDARACATCHREIADEYARTGMGRSFFRPRPSNTLESYAGDDLYHAPSDTHFSMALRDGKYDQRRWQIGFGGNESNVEELRIDYVLGSGNHA